LVYVVERSGNYVFEEDTPPPLKALKARVVSYSLRTYTVFIESVVVETWKRAHSIGNTKASTLFNSRK
jgi:hypothetical protein